jgi:hypothetical protein
MVTGWAQETVTGSVMAKDWVLPAMGMAYYRETDWVYPETVYQVPERAWQGRAWGQV